jgi:hypothetical protein
MWFVGFDEESRKLTGVEVLVEVLGVVEISIGDVRAMPLAGDGRVWNQD